VCPFLIAVAEPGPVAAAAVDQGHVERPIADGQGQPALEMEGLRRSRESNPRLRASFGEFLLKPQQISLAAMIEAKAQPNFLKSCVNVNVRASP